MLIAFVLRGSIRRAPQIPAKSKVRDGSSLFLFCFLSFSGRAALAADMKVIEVFYKRTLSCYRQAMAFENSAHVCVKLALFLSQTGTDADEVEDLLLKV